MFTKIGEFLKKYWQTILLVGALVVGYLYFQGVEDRNAEAIKQITDSHQIVVDKINEARAEEAKQHAEQVKQLQESIAKIQEDYAKAVEDLAKEREARKQEIVRKYGDKPDDLARLLAEQYGFIVKPAP